MLQAAPSACDGGGLPGSSQRDSVGMRDARRCGDHRRLVGDRRGDGARAGGRGRVRRARRTPQGSDRRRSRSGSRATAAGAGRARAADARRTRSQARCFDRAAPAMQLGGLDVAAVLNNAGVMLLGPSRAPTPWRRCIDVNLLGRSSAPGRAADDARAGLSTSNVSCRCRVERASTRSTGVEQLIKRARANGPRCSADACRGRRARRLDRRRSAAATGRLLGAGCATSRSSSSTGCEAHGTRRAARERDRGRDRDATTSPAATVTRIAWTQLDDEPEPSRDRSAETAIQMYVITYAA